MSAALCLAGRVQGMEMLLISICLAFLLLFSFQINVRDLFQPLSKLREMGAVGMDGKILSR